MFIKALKTKHRPLAFLFVLAICQLGFGQSEFPERSIFFSGGITSEKMLNASTTQIDISPDQPVIFPTSFSTGTVASFEIGLINKRKEGRNGWNLLSVQTDFANLYNDLITYQDTFVRTGSPVFLISNEIQKGDNIFVSKKEFKPWVLRRGVARFGRLYSKALFKSKFQFTFGASILAGFEHKTWYSFRPAFDLESFNEDFSILSGLDLNYMLSYPIGSNIRIMVKGISNFIDGEITSSKRENGSDSVGFDIDASLNVDVFHAGLLFTLKK